MSLSSKNLVYDLEGEGDKVGILRNIKKDCLRNVCNYKKKYRRLKRVDESLDAFNALLTGTSISLIVAGMGIPPLLIASASISGGSFIIQRVQDKFNMKQKYMTHNLTFSQYSDLAREITSVLSKNNLSQDEYHRYIVECLDKISLIEDSQLF